MLCLCRNLAVGCLRPRLWNLLSGEAQPFNVKLNGIAYFALDLLPGAAGGDAARQIRGIGRQYQPNATRSTWPRAAATAWKQRWQKRERRQLLTGR